VTSSVSYGLMNNSVVNSLFALFVRSW